MLPQAVRISLPPMTNDFIALLKDSSLVSLVTLTELTKTYSMLANATHDHLGLGAVVAPGTSLIGLPFVFLARRLERRLGRSPRGGAMIRVTALTKTHPGAAAPTLRDLSFDAPAGALVAILGRSGAGKSTLLRCACGLDGFDAGAIEVDGTRVEGGADPAPLLGKVGLVFQSLELFPHLRVIENLVLAPVRARGARSARGARARERSVARPRSRPTRSARSRRRSRAGSASASRSPAR